MYNKSLAIFTNNVSDNIIHIENIKKFFKHEGFDDFTIFTDEIENILPEHSMLATFYMVGHRGLIVFLNFEDYILYKDNLYAKTIIFISSDDFSLERNDIKDCDILTYKNDSSLQWIKKNEIQRTI